MTTNYPHLVSAVRRYAEAHYTKDGWDYLVECWEDADIIEAMGNATSVEEAINNCLRIVSLLDERRTEVTNEIF